MSDPAGAFVPHGHFRVEPTREGPLSGLTFAAKDLFDVAGHPTGAGNPTWLATHPVPTRHSAVVRSLLDHGATLIGKTITDELAYSLNGDNIHYGTPLNSRAPDRVPGGSSSGSASAVAAGACDFALGTDTGGSVRIPASFCGIWGVRTTHGAISKEGLVPLMPSYDAVGFFARDIDVMLKVGEVLLPPSPEVRWSGAVAFEDAWALADPDYEPLLAAVTRAVATCVGPVRKVNVADEGLQQWRSDFVHASAHEGWQVHGAWIEAHTPAFAAPIAQRFAFAKTVSEEAAQAAHTARMRYSERVRSLLVRDTVAILPTAPGPAPLLRDDSAAVDEFRTRIQRLTCIAGHAGLPQVNIPLVGPGGLPMGVSLLGPAGSDLALLRLAGLRIIRELVQRGEP
jgi:amidase